MSDAHHWMAFLDSRSALEINDNNMAIELLAKIGLTLKPNVVSSLYASKSTKCHTNTPLSWLERRVHEVTAESQKVPVL